MTNEQYEELYNKKNEADRLIKRIEDSKNFIKHLEDWNGERNMHIINSHTNTSVFLKDYQVNALLIFERNELMKLEKEYTEL